MMAVLAFGGFNARLPIAKIFDSYAYTSIGNQEYYYVDGNRFVPWFNGTAAGALLLTNGNSGDGAIRTFTTSDPNITLAMGFLMGSGAASWGTVRDIGELRIGGVPALRVRWTTASRTLSVIKASDSSALCTTVDAFIENTWYLLELRVVRGVTGSVQLRMDGLVVASATGIDTTDGQGGNWSAVRFMSNDPDSNGSTGRQHQLSEYAVVEGLGAGDIRVLTTRPATQGFHNDFVASSGVNKPTLIDNVPSNPSEFVSASAGGERDSYTFSTQPESPTRTRVLAVEAVGLAQSDGLDLKLSARRGTTDYDGVTHVAPSGVVRQRWDQDPSTAASWTLSNVAGSQWGVVAVAP
jgi:hypothetical protein